MGIPVSFLLAFQNKHLTMRLAIGFVLLIASVHSLPNAEVHLTEEEFEEKFNVKINDPEERKREAKILAEVEDEINENNAKFEKGESTYQEELNQYSNLPMDVFEKYREGAKMPEDEGRGLGLLVPPEYIKNEPENAARMNEIYRQLEMDRQEVPESYDATELGLVTPVKNQKSCGSCAAFAAHGLHETCLRKAGIPMEGLDLSEQYLLDCGYDGYAMNACGGAWAEAYSVWLAKNGGLSAHEGKYPYLNRNPLKNCDKAKGLEWKSGAKVDEALYSYSSNEKKLKQMLVKYGAVAVALYASDRGFNNYKSGVFDGCTSTGINHAVLLVGYGTENGVPYWKIKNSWGKNWGDQGYIKIKRGENMCGVEGLHVVTSCSKTGDDAEPVPPVPTSKPIPADLQCDISGIYEAGMTGTYKLRTMVNGKEYLANVICKESICTPENPGPSNACMYICGMLKCTKSTTAGPQDTTTASPQDTTTASPQDTTTAGPQDTTTASPQDTTTTEMIMSSCNIRKLIKRKRYNGRIVVNMFDGTTDKWVVVKCSNSVCPLEVPYYMTACDYFCGKAADAC